MNRREFIAGLCGAAAWPLVARAARVGENLARGLSFFIVGRREPVV